MHLCNLLEPKFTLLIRSQSHILFLHKEENITCEIKEFISRFICVFNLYTVENVFIYCASKAPMKFFILWKIF